MIDYRINSASEECIREHLAACSDAFAPPLSTHVNIPEYAGKIRKNAETFEAWSRGRLIGLVAAYMNDKLHGRGFITHVCTDPGYQRRGIAGRLLDTATRRAGELVLRSLELEVPSGNVAARGLYRSHGFAVVGSRQQKLVMIKEVERGGG